eukprot:g8235.t1
MAKGETRTTAEIPGSCGIGSASDHGDENISGLRGDSWGDKAFAAMSVVKGKAFVKEMQKKKKASWRGGGAIDMGERREQTMTASPGLSAATSRAAGPCPCCEERTTKRGGFRFLLQDDAPLDACIECVIEDDKFRYDKFMREPDDFLYPPFRWPRTAAKIEQLAAAVVADTTAVLDRVGGLGLKQDGAGELTFENVIAPLMTLPVYKTNQMVCEAKHLQHCSTDPVVREAAGKAAQQLAGCKKMTKTRKDVYERVLQGCFCLVVV